jgi:hypothetical protein
MTGLPIALKELKRKVSPRLNAIIPRAIFEMSPEEAINWSLMRLLRDGPRRIPTMINAVTVGSLIF